MSTTNKPITPLAHGLIDYGFVTCFAVLPKCIGLNPRAIKLYRLLALNLGTYNALTDHGAAVMPLIPFRTHYKIDFGNLAGLALFAAHPAIRKQKRALLFHATFLAIATANVLLTNWKKR